MTPKSSGAGLRADALRNRDALLAAARRVFADLGLDAPLEAVAREAGVGRATLYRRFPTREALLRSLLDDNLEMLALVARDAHDPARAYLAILAACVELLRRDQGFFDMLACRPPAEPLAHDLEQRFVAVVEQPLREAQAAGVVRGDLRADDTLLIVQLLGTAARPSAARRHPARNARAVALVLEAILTSPGRYDLRKSRSVTAVFERAVRGGDARRGR